MEENLDFSQLQKWGEQKTFERQKSEDKCITPPITTNTTHNEFSLIIDEERLRYLSEK